MRGERTKLARIQFIDRKIRAGKYPNCRTLSEEYEVSESTIRRDIQYMKEMLDLPVEYDSINNGYYYTEPTVPLPDIQVSEKDLFALCIAERSLEQYRETPLYETLVSSFKKITGGLTEKIMI